MYLALQVLWVVCSVASIAFALRLSAVQNAPRLRLWAVWTAVAYPLTFALNLYSQKFYRAAWPVFEVIAVALLSVAVVETFHRTCSGVRGIGGIRDGLFHFCLGLGVLAGMGCVAVGHVTNPASLLLLASHGLTVALAVFVVTFLAFFLLNGQKQTPNTAINARMMLLYLVVFGGSRIAANYVATSAIGGLVAMIATALIFIVWARLIKVRGGDMKPGARITEYPDPEFGRELTGLVRGIRERQRAT